MDNTQASIFSRQEGNPLAVILITGCSTGIGRDLAGRLAQAGSTVIATARNVETLEGIPAALKLPLDVTRPASIEQAIQKTLEHFDRIDILVNNAGYAILGALEEIPDEPLQQVFDVNVFGALRMIRAVTPHMRKQGTGRIINISSIGGKLSTPTNGVYSATKFALEALSDALRVELAPFGIRVISIEPGPIKTEFHQTSHRHAAPIMHNPDSPYRALYQKCNEVAANMRQREAGPQAVSKVVLEAIEARKPKARYLAGVSLPIRVVIALRDIVWDGLLHQMFKIAP